MTGAFRPLIIPVIQIDNRSQPLTPRGKALAKRCTFVDSGVLLAAFKAGGELAENALAVCEKPTKPLFRVTGIQVTTVRPPA